MKTIAFRLKPGSDLRTSIEKVVADNGIKAGFIVTCVGAIERVKVRMAGATPESQDIRIMKADFEIVSLVGTVSIHDSHLHISFSDKDGVVYGGHLKEGTIVNPTAEVVLGYDDTIEFTREPDEDTGYDELVIK